MYKQQHGSIVNLRDFCDITPGLSNFFKKNYLQPNLTAVFFSSVIVLRILNDSEGKEFLH